jgi:hypothetical protein
MHQLLQLVKLFVCGEKNKRGTQRECVRGGNT